MQERALAPEPSEHWMVTELRFVRVAAQLEADAAYEGWKSRPGRMTYAVYRAAQDRADAAQEHLAQWLRRSCAR